MTKVNQQELIERLKKRHDAGTHPIFGDFRNPDGPEAAEALQSLLVENELLREALLGAQGVLHNLTDEGHMSQRAPILKFIKNALGDTQP